MLNFKINLSNKDKWQQKKNKNLSFFFRTNRNSFNSEKFLGM